MMLNEKALEAAQNAYMNHPGHDGAMQAAITAYLSALPPVESAGLIAEARASQVCIAGNIVDRLANALENAEARAVEAERERDNLRRNYQDQIAKSVVAVCRAVDERKAAERQLAAAREVLKPVACRCRKTCLDGVHDCWRRKARAALSAAPAPVSGDEDDDKRECENCGKRAVFDTMHDVGDGAYICEPCYADWKKTFDACDHDWKPGEHDGYQGMYCEKCVGFMREEPAPAPVSGEDDETLTIIARSIGRTIREENHHQRARDVIRSLRERDMTLPTPAPSQNGGE